MDLTSAERALFSLSRRGASATDIEVAEKLRRIYFEENQSSKTQDCGIPETESFLLQLLQSQTWESNAAAYISCAELLQKKVALRKEFLFGTLCDSIDKNLEHVEPRIRSSVVKLLRELAVLDGKQTWDHFGNAVFQSIEKNLEVDSEERARVMQEIYALELGKSSKQEKPVMAHETVGWKALETSLRGLQNLISGYGSKFVFDGYLDLPLVDLVTLKCLKHENRYVREVGFDLCTSMVEVLGDALDDNLEDAFNDLKADSSGSILDKLARAVGLGLSDNWSQVRFAASVSVRTLLVRLSNSRREPYLDDLVPRMCLNRYYLAQGVKLYSQETWNLVFGESGPGIVSAHIHAVVEYYCRQCRADNHAVREAACYCIAELSTKVDKVAVAPNVDGLLQALIDAFKDESWPVRDAACIATSNFISGFPNESKALVEQELYDLWFAHLSDNIWSVREDSAIALGNVMRTYGKDAIDRVKKQLTESLPSTFNEKLESCNHSEHETEHKHSPESQRLSDPSNSNAAAKYASRESQPRGIVTGDLKHISTKKDKYSNQQQFSCGSLAPKLRRGVGCMDHGFSREKMAWEVTDGGIYLLRELAAVEASSAEEFLVTLSDIAVFASKNVTKNDHLFTLQETLWKQLVPIAKSMGKRPFKRHLEPFLKPMIEALQYERQNQLCAHAAGSCIEQLEQFLGKEIFKGRIQQLDMESHNLLRILDDKRYLINPIRISRDS